VSKTRNGPSDIAFSTDKGVLDSDYAYYAVMSLEKQLQSRAHGTAQQAINMTDVDAVLTDLFQNMNKVDSKVDDGVLGQTTDPMKFDNAEDFIKASIFSHARDSGVRSKLRKSFDNIKEVESADILKPNPNNPKLDSDTVKIKEGLIEEGNRPYILVDGENVIDGHHALQAYRNLGFDEVFVVQKSKAVDSFYNKTTKADNAAFAFPIGGGLLGGEEETQSEELTDGLINNVKSWKPNNNLVTFVKTMENDPLRVGNVKVKEYDDVGHKAKGYGTKSGLLAQDTEAEASKAMSNKLVDANKAVDRLVKIDLNKNQRNALVSLVYNVGATGFGKSNALKELNKGNIKAFLKEAFDPKVGFVRTKGKIVKGLVNRRAREKMIFTKGNYGN
jgi:GH24 family phage-related lysozyme (muramidase)